MARLASALILCLLPVTVGGAEFFTLKGHGGPVMGIAVSPTGQIATASFDNAVGLWNGNRPTWLDGHEAAVNTVLFADGAVYSGGDDNTVRRWSSPGAVVGTHQAKVVHLAAAPGLLASASWDGTIGLWPLAGDAQPRFLRGHTSGVTAVAFSEDRRTLFSAGVDGTIRHWDLATATEKRVILRNGFGINVMALNAADGWLAYGSVDGVTRVVDPVSGRELHDFTLDRRPILAMALSPEGDRLAVGDGEGYIMVIDTDNWRIARDFRATLRGPVWALAFSADGENIHAGGLDDAMYSWPVATLGDHARMATQDPSFLRDPDEMENGERQFARKCSICHTLTPDSARRAGPTLHALFGRPAGTIADYSYSDTLDSSDIVWDEDSINALFDQGPDHYIPGSKMPMQRITDPQDRADLIAYLRRATTPEDP